MAVNSFADKLVKKIFGTSSDVFLKNVKPIVAQINDLEATVKAMSDDELKAQTPKFKEMIANALDGIDDKEERRKAEQEILHKLLPEAFATVREGSRRVTGMRHFDVQLVGGIALHQGRIAEMRTGEGKTLVATLPSYLNGLTGRGVHVVTVNDYLALTRCRMDGQDSQIPRPDGRLYPKRYGRRRAQGRLRLFDHVRHE